MSNSYYNFAPAFVSGTTVKAAPVNAQFTAVQSGFALVETASKTAIKLSGYSSSSAITATPSSLLQLNASGIPYASATVGFSPNFGGNRLQNVGNATVGTDAPSYGQITAYIATIAFGSPNVLTVPSFSGNALKNLRLNAGATALEFAEALPTSTNSGEVLSTVSGSPTWSGPSFNLLQDPSLLRTVTVGDGVYWSAPGAGIAAAASPEHPVETLLSWPSSNYVQTVATASPPVTVGRSYTASAYFRCGTATNFLIFMRFLDVSYVAIGSDYTSAVPSTADSVNRRCQVTATAPSGAAYVQVGIKNTGSSNATNAYCSLFQLEEGTFATPWKPRNPDAYGSASLISYLLTSGTLVPTARLLSGGFPVAANLELGGSNYSSGNYAVRFSATSAGAYDGTDGTLALTAKRFIMGKTAGFASVYDNGSLGATPTVDWYNGQKQKGTVTANTTITLTAPDSDIVLDGLRLMLQNNATGGYTTAFTSAATIKWKGNVVPTMPTAASAEMEVTFFWDGTRFLGSWAAI